MFGYRDIKALAKRLRRSVNDLLALNPQNDPFYADLPRRRVGAEWFANVYHEHGGDKPHQRRIHYRTLSRVLHPDGHQYQNTYNDWKYLGVSSLTARYLDLIPPDGLADMRNDPPLINAKDVDPEEELEAFSGVAEGTEEPTLDIPDIPELPELGLGGFDVVQDYIVEIWIEKSTQNDWLVPLCERRGINLVVGIGEQSEIRARELALRSAAYKAPVRVIYISDFDPGGRSMPKAVARKVEFTIYKLGLDVDFQLLPVALTLEQIRHYNLPRIPIKETERRKDRFEDTFGVGATELDAMEALHPGELARIVEAEIDNWLDPDLARRVREVRSEQSVRVAKITKRVHTKHAEQIEELTNRFEEIVEELREWETEADELWQTIADHLAEEKPDLSEVEVPRSEAPGATDKFVLFDSKRDYLTQMDAYNSWKIGGEGEDADE
jgi:hypothetical protein